MAEHCNRCRFWLEDMKVRDPNDENWGFGRCRLSPPVLLERIVAMQVEPPSYGKQTDLDLYITSLFTASEHPVTFATDWCGRFEAQAS